MLEPLLLATAQIWIFSKGFLKDGTCNAGIPGNCKQLSVTYNK